MEVAKLNLTLGSAQREFLFRKGTIDELVIIQVLKTSAYDLHRLRRGPELVAFYEQLAAGRKMPLIVDASANIGASSVFFSYKFPKARVIAFEPDAGNFQLLTANTAGLPVECVQAAVAPTGSADDATPRVTLNDIYDKTPDAAPFIVKLDVENDIGLLAENTEWIARTPAIIAALSDYLVPGTPSSRTFVAHAAGWNRDFFYQHDNIFSISREAGLAQAAA